MKQKELFSFKKDYLVYVLDSDWWISGLTPKIKSLANQWYDSEFYNDYDTIMWYNIELIL